MAGFERDPHSKCQKCRGQDCTRTMTCTECESWTEYEKKKKYKNRPKKSGSVASGEPSAKGGPSAKSVPVEPRSTAVLVHPDDDFGMTMDEFWRAEHFMRVAQSVLQVPVEGAGVPDSSLPVQTGPLEGNPVRVDVGIDQSTVPPPGDAGDVVDPAPAPVVPFPGVVVPGGPDHENPGPHDGDHRSEYSTASVSGVETEATEYRSRGRARSGVPTGSSERTRSRSDVRPDSTCGDRPRSPGSRRDHIRRGDRSDAGSSRYQSRDWYREVTGSDWWGPGARRGPPSSFLRFVAWEREREEARDSVGVGTFFSDCFFGS